MESPCGNVVEALMIKVPFHAWVVKVLKGNIMLSGDDTVLNILIGVIGWKCLG